MQYDEIARLQEQHPSWALLRSSHAALILSFISRVFLEANSGARPAAELVNLLDDELYALNQRLGSETRSRAWRRPISTTGRHPSAAGCASTTRPAPTSRTST